MRGMLLIALLALAGCSVTYPAAVVGQRGDVLVGTVTGSLAGGSYHVTNGRLSCTGTYDPMQPGPVINFDVVCTDGRRGFGTAIREAGGQQGRGSVRLDDGETGDFVFGPVARTMVAKQRAP